MIDRTNETGFSLENPVVIKANNSKQGVDAEYDWIEAHFGERDKSWQFFMQQLFYGPAGQLVDIIKIQLADGNFQELFFDTSSIYRAFFGTESEED